MIMWGQNNYQDINKTLNVCKTSVLTFSGPDGFGSIDDLAEDTAKGCLTGELNSMWLKVTIAEAGDFGFNINSSTGRDYDFAVYKSINVNNTLTREPLSCSFTQTTNITGVGDSNQTGFEEWISATKGEVYYILINSTNSNTGDEIEFELTGNAEYDCVDTYRPELPEWTSQSTCEQDFIALDAQPTNLSSTVQIYYEWEKDGVSLDYHEAVLNVTEAGVYTVHVTANLLSPVTQSVEITGNPNDPAPSLELVGYENNTVYFCQSDGYPTIRVNSSSNNIKWFVRSNRGNLVDTGITGKEFTLYNMLTIVPIAYSESGCNSTSLSIKPINYPKESISGDKIYPICNQNPTLTVESSSNIVEWYNEDGNLQFTGKSWNNVPEGEYYAIAKGTAGSTCDSNKFNVSVIPDNTPTELFTNDVIYCGTDNLKLEIFFKDDIGKEEASVVWYNSEVGGGVVGRGNPTFPSEETGTYWAEVTSYTYCTQPERIPVYFAPSEDAPELISNSDYYGFCETQIEETISVTTEVNDDKVLWYTDKGVTPLLDSNGNQVTGKEITVNSSGNYWVQAIGENNCSSNFVKIPVLKYNAPELRNPPTEFYSCGDNDVETPTLRATNNTIDMNDPNSIEWYSTSDLNPANLLGKGNNFILPKEFIGQTVYLKLINRIGCISTTTYAIDIVYNDIPSIEASTDLDQFYCQDITPNPLGAKTDSDNYEIIWYNNEGIERGRTQNGQTINPDPEDYASSDVTTYFAEAVNPASGCTSERLAFTFNKVTPPVISAASATELSYCRDSEYEELNITISNGEAKFIKWFDSNNVQVGTGTKLVLVDLKNGIDLGDGIFYATASSDGKNCASNTVTFNVNELDLTNAVIETPYTLLFEGDTLQFNTTVPEDIDTYYWTGPNGFTSESATPIIEDITLEHSGQYNVFIANKCESKSLSINIEVYANGETSIGADKVVCIDEIISHEINLSEYYPQDKNFSYQWYGPRSFSSTSEAIIIRETGRYVVTITDPETNHSTTGSIAVYNSTLQLENDNIETCYGQTVLNPVGGTQPYQFALDNGAWQDNPFFNNISEGYHTYKVQDANGCEVEVAGEYFKPFILRKAFTPNGDGYNDTWDLSLLSGCTYLDIKIFDRYGRYLHQIKTHNLKWNGYANGKPLPSGTYWYVIEFNDGITPTLKGPITIRRTKD